MPKCFLALLLAAAAPPLLHAQRPQPLTQASVRALTRQAEGEARGDRSEIVLGLDRRVRDRWGDFESFPISIVRREDLTIVLTTPFMSYRRAVAEHLRMRETLAGVPWVNHAVISVSPERIDSPDVARIAVARDGHEASPLRNALRPMTFTNGNGDTAVIHGGELHYAMSVFAPGATVTITATPAAGEPFVVTLNSEQLAMLK
jgi:hypothetical protein